MAKRKSAASAERTIERVLAKMDTAEVDRLVPDEDPEFRQIADAIMAWYQMLMASGIVKTGEKSAEVLGSSLIVLGSLVKYVYALGLRRGERRASQKRRR